MALCAAALIATAAQAEPEGCYHRSYDAAHLAAHPAQVVEAISMNFTRDQYGLNVALDVISADGGHVGALGLGGLHFDQSLSCYQDDPVACAVDCDGGSFTVVRDTGDVLDIRTEHLTVGATEECGGAINIAEQVGAPTTYRLYKSAPEACVVN
ncbi:hypothetical protein [Maritimibacter sp. UBA3975]|uniref:hypothetical protein n=1 Tax=Maritimibacter sp. UBA3975 TaxID=1946833 RepID=UPI000C0958D2|nr:hypothetical protein [Maritimibacter sp. UBA3975]MAM61003.1 hypothetical protein [Maritimibacter sp.]